jgi:hypothetical protein
MGPPNTIMTRTTKDSLRPGSSRLQQEEISEEDQSREPPWIWKGRAEFFQTIPSTKNRKKIRINEKNKIKRRKSTPQEDLSNILASSDFIHDCQPSPAHPFCTLVNF